MNTEKTILIDADLHKRLKLHCVENNIKIKEFISKLIIDVVGGVNEKK